MTRLRVLIVLAMMLVLGAALLAAVEAQAAEGQRRRPGRFLGRGSLLGLLRLEQVRKEMKLTEEQTAKIKEIVEKLGAEMREQFTALREIEDRAQRRAKMTELGDQFDSKLREQLRDVVPREQMMRLYQIRMQIRPVVDSLSNRYVVRRLELTEEQQKKIADISKEMQAKQSELFGTMRDATDEQRSEAFQKLRQIRDDADQKALAVLTAKQKEAFEKMKGEKFELEMRRGGQ